MRSAIMSSTRAAPSCCGCRAAAARNIRPATPCAVEPFDGADFKFLAANVLRGDGTTLFPGTAIKDFGPVQVGFIGMTLKETATLVTPAGVAGLTFADEAATANAAIPALKAAGADAIVLLIHQGGRTSGGYNDKSCPNLDGDIMPILAKLDPAIDAVISGHTHTAYICELPRHRRTAAAADQCRALRHADQRYPPDFATRRGVTGPPGGQRHRPGRSLCRFGRPRGAAACVYRLSQGPGHRSVGRALCRRRGAAGGSGGRQARPPDNQGSGRFPGGHWRQFHCRRAAGSDEAPRRADRLLQQRRGARRYRPGGPTARLPSASCSQCSRSAIMWWSGR